MRVFWKNWTLILVGIWIIVWNAFASEKMNPILEVGHSDNVLSVTFSSDGRYLASGSKEIKILDVVNRSMVCTIENYTHIAAALAFSPNGKYLASAHEKEIRLWDTSTCRLLRTFKGHKNYVTSVVFSPDGKYLASGSKDKTIRIWDVKTGHLIKTFEGHRGGVTSLAFSPNGKYIASGSEDCVIKLWDVKNGRLVNTFNSHRDSVNSVVFSPDGRYIASGGRNTIRIWDAGTSGLIRTIRGPIKTVYAGMYYHKNIEEPIHGYLVRTVAFSPDGKYIASGGNNKYIKIWDVKNGHLVKKIEGHKGGINFLAFSPKEKYLLASGGKDYTVKVWKLSESNFLTVDKNSTTTKTTKVSKKTAKSVSTKSVSTSSPETQYLKQLHEKIKKGGAGYLMGSGFDKDTDKGIEIIKKNIQGIMNQ